jgi:hypothetical protein
MKNNKDKKQLSKENDEQKVRNDKKKAKKREEIK